MFEADAQEGWQQQLEEERMRTNLDCLIVIYKDGHEGTADHLARELGLGNEWRKEKEHLAQRCAA